MEQGGGDVTKWLLQTSLSDQSYRHLDLWEILEYHFGWVCDLESIDTPYIFNVIHSTAALARMSPTLDWSGQFPDEPVRIKDTPEYQFTM